MKKKGWSLSLVVLLSLLFSYLWSLFLSNVYTVLWSRTSFSLLFKKKKKREYYPSCLEQILILTGVCGIFFCTCRDDGTGGASNTEYAWGRREKRWCGVQDQEAAAVDSKKTGAWSRQKYRQTRVVAQRWCRQTSAIVPAVTKTDTGCRAGGDAGRHGLSCRWWRRQTRVVVPVGMQADTGCRAGGDADRHGLSCRWGRRQTRVVVPVGTQAETGCRAGEDAGRHGLSCRCRCRKVQAATVSDCRQQSAAGGGNRARAR